MGMTLRQWLINQRGLHDFSRKFIKKSHHKKKTLSEKQIRKKEWREHKKLRRDKSRREPHFDYSELYRDENSRAYRRWVKERIAHHDYDLSKGWKKYAFRKVDWLW